MRFLKVYAATLVLSFLFVFVGGWMLFDFGARCYVATAACAFLLAAVVTAFLAQAEKIEALEKRVKELEEKNNPTK